MLFNFQLKTPNEGLVNITNEVTEAVSESGVNEGICVVFCPHTTAAITINENADPDVKSDFVLGMDKIFPNLNAFRHAEGAYKVLGGRSKRDPHRKRRKALARNLAGRLFL